jgi:hypothetical protein
MQMRMLVRSESAQAADSVCTLAPRSGGEGGERPRREPGEGQEYGETLPLTRPSP